MKWLLLAVCMIFAGLSVWLFLRDRQKKQEELRQMEQMRSSRLYKTLYPQIKVLRGYALDRIEVDTECVTFYGVCPAKILYRFYLPEYGFRAMSQKRLWTLTQVMAEDMEDLRNKAHFKLRCLKKELPNGGLTDVYSYDMRSSYKTYLMNEWKNAPELFAA